MLNNVCEEGNEGKDGGGEGDERSEVFDPSRKGVFGLECSIQLDRARS
jgi:hypothetical protein